jgi:hypothetical protein
MALDHSALYYTYSTISQTLAGAFGFIIAAIIYGKQGRLDFMHQLNTRVIHASSNLQRMRLPQPTQAREFEIQHETQIRELETQLKSDTEALRKFGDEVLSLQNRLMLSLKMTVWTILASLIFMPLTNESSIFGAPYIRWVPLVVTVLAAIGTIRTYYPLVEDLTRTR